MLSEDELWISGSTIGFFGSGRVWSSADGGKSLTMFELAGKGGGQVFGLSMASDGKTGFATTISAGGSDSAAAIWHYQA